MKIIKIFSVLVLLAYAAICAYLYTQQTKLLYFPQVEDKEYSKRFEHFEMQFQNGNIALHGWGNIQNVSTTNPLLIYYYGNGDEASRTLPRLAKIGTSNFLVMNYRGYGRSQGIPNEKALKQDAIFVLDKVIKQYQINPDSIIVMGRSLGSGLATYVASQRDVAKVILVTPYDSIVNVAKDRFPMFPVSLLMHQRFESDKLAPKINKPLLCLIAETDRIVPSKHAHRVCDLWKGRKHKVTLSGTNHNTINDSSEYTEFIKNFLSSK